MSFLDERRFVLCLLLCSLFFHALSDVLLCEFVALCLVVLVESHVVVADEVVALLARRLRSLAVAPLLPCQHRLADMDTAVVHDVSLNNLVAIGCNDAR